MELLVRAGIDPGGMVGFFEYLWECECKKEKKTKRRASLSTSRPIPPRRTGSNILKRTLVQSHPGITPLLQGVDWEKVKNSCSGGPPGGKDKQDEEAPKTNEAL